MLKFNTPDEFDKFLQKYDWFYYQSDCHQKWAAGTSLEKQLLEFVTSASAEFKTVYNKHHALNFNTKFFVSKERPYKIPFDLN